MPCSCCSYKRAKQPGSFTRLLSCTDEQLQNYKGLDLVPTHVVPSLTMDPNKEHNDHYSAYNKPGAVLFWLQVPLLEPLSNLSLCTEYCARILGSPKELFLFETERKNSFGTP